MEKIGQKITQIEDLIQSLNDVVTLTNEITETQFQGLLSWSNEYLTKMEALTGKRS